MPALRTMSLGGAPPGVWALDVGPRPHQQSPSAPAPRAPEAADVEQVSGAWKHVKTVVREDAKSAELYDLLSHSVRETQYSFQPQGVRPMPAWQCPTLQCSSGSTRAAAANVRTAAAAAARCCQRPHCSHRCCLLLQLLLHQSAQAQLSCVTQAAGNRRPPCMRCPQVRRRRRPCVQWPSLLRPLSPILNEMPGMVLERYGACQTVAFCGVFPDIRRAWASVDNSLFLWRFDKWCAGGGGREAEGRAAGPAVAKRTAGCQRLACPTPLLACRAQRRGAQEEMSEPGRHVVWNRVVCAASILYQSFASFLTTLTFAPAALCCA